ncbi:uncharacterized protein [Arachis hypogaea]|uniref:uncharacterized protein n=1 Tax=Arachis hypogaea TaxID=3818 RepID=UPI003B21DDF0
MKHILQKTYIAGRMLQWVVKLSKFDVTYETRTKIKFQYLADFVAEYTEGQENPSTWNLYVDRSSNKFRSGAGVILENEEGTQIELSLKFEFSAFNNQAEYEALLASLMLAKEVGTERLIVFSDSQMITSQVNEIYENKDPNMKKYLEEAREQLAQFSKKKVWHIS